MPTTRIAVKRIVIEVNRDLTVEQVELLDETLKKIGLVKTTKITLHSHELHKVRPQKALHHKAPTSAASRGNVPSPVSG